MNYEKVLADCEDTLVGTAVLNAINLLFERDTQLLAVNASERSIAAKLAQYLQPHFPNLHVDVEYNRMGDAPKKVTWSEKPDEVYPDIIVHIRTTNTNILAIELKKDSNPEKKERDILKLRAYRHELGYAHALFIRLGVGKDSGTVSECEWIMH
ncbi:MAG: hypothetical protein PHG89_11175 [Gallionella sp.]|nr:hypothetical protein [Gallionella sp.]